MGALDSEEQEERGRSTVSLPTTCFPAGQEWSVSSHYVPIDAGCGWGPSGKVLTAAASAAWIAKTGRECQD